MPPAHALVTVLLVIVLIVLAELLKVSLIQHGLQINVEISFTEILTAVNVFFSVPLKEIEHLLRIMNLQLVSKLDFMHLIQN